MHKVIKVINKLHNMEECHIEQEVKIVDEKLVEPIIEDLDTNQA